MSVFTLTWTHDQKRIIEKNKKKPQKSQNGFYKLKKVENRWDRRR